MLDLVQFVDREDHVQARAGHARDELSQLRDELRRSRLDLGHGRAATEVAAEAEHPPASRPASRQTTRSYVSAGTGFAAVTNAPVQNGTAALTAERYSPRSRAGARPSLAADLPWAPLDALVDEMLTRMMALRDGSAS